MNILKRQAVSCITVWSSRKSVPQLGGTIVSLQALGVAVITTFFNPSRWRVAGRAGFQHLAFVFKQTLNYESSIHYV